MNAAAPLVCALLAAVPDPAWLKPAGHVSVRVAVEPGARRSDATLVVEVTPASGIHLYAPGNENYIPVALTLEEKAGVRMGRPVYPASEPLVFGELRETVQVYQKPFTIRQPMSILPESRQAPISLTGTLRYQACTDTVCYRPASERITATVPAVPRGGKSR